MNSELNYICGCVSNNTMPEEDKISLKGYCSYFEQYIENHIIKIILNNGSYIQVKINAKEISHIMDIHQFYNNKVRNKALRFQGSFTGIDAFVNMKKGNINLSVLKLSNNGKTWNNKMVKSRVLGFPFVLKALKFGTWYEFDIKKFNFNTKLDYDYTVTYQVEGVFLNFCIKKQKIMTIFVYQIL